MRKFTEKARRTRRMAENRMPDIEEAAGKIVTAVPRMKDGIKRMVHNL